MNKSQLKQMQSAQGFIAALDQSGGSTPKALLAYGIDESEYNDETEMFKLIHKMRSRIIKSPYFNNDRILAAILFENTMESKIDGQYTADYLRDEKGIIPFLKIDKGLQDLKDGVQLMKDNPTLDNLLKRAVEHNIFGTKMRSVIKAYDEKGIDAILKQQFEIAQIILDKGLVPIVEPEVDINAKDKEKIETYLHQGLRKELDKLPSQVVLKLTPPSVANLYQDLLAHPNVMRIAFLSGGHSRAVANTLLEKNPGVIASFSRALTEGLSVNQDDDLFNKTLNQAIDAIYQASIK